MNANLLLTAYYSLVTAHRSGEVMNANFALRRRVYGDECLGESNLAMIAVAQEGRILTTPYLLVRRRVVHLFLARHSPTLTWFIADSPLNVIYY